VHELTDGRRKPAMRVDDKDNQEFTVKKELVQDNAGSPAPTGAASLFSAHTLRRAGETKTGDNRGAPETPADAGRHRER